MNKWDCKSAKVGENLPDLIVGPISRTNLALYAGASGDHNPLHIDTDYANRIGLPDVIAHGMLIMGYLGRVLTNNMNQNQILEYGVQFSSITNIGDVLCCSGIVKEISGDKSNKILKLELNVKDQDNDTKLKGYSLIKAS
jgi:acyl dehydratase|tara:strand:- start:1129 stop:1548 length:420 start_codon:yes stop_codon:yes gene_type:complete